MTGLMLAWRFVQTIRIPGSAPPPSLVVAAIAAAMIAAGDRYIATSSGNTCKKPEEGSPS